MRLYLRTRRAGVVVLVMLGAGMVTGALGATSVPVPRLAGGPAYGTVLALLAPAPTVAFLGWGLTGRRLEGELAALRPVRLLDVAWVVMCLGTFAAAVVGCSSGGL